MSGLPAKSPTTAFLLRKIPTQRILNGRTRREDSQWEDLRWEDQEDSGGRIPDGRTRRTLGGRIPDGKIRREDSGWMDSRLEDQKDSGWENSRWEDQEDSEWVDSSSEDSGLSSQHMKRFSDPLLNRETQMKAWGSAFLPCAD